MPKDTFVEAQQKMLSRFGVEAETRFVAAPVVGGRAQVLVAGTGPPIVMLNGLGTPAAMWAPLMAELPGLTLYAVDLPAFGLTDTTPDIANDLRESAVRFLHEVLGELDLDRPAFVGNSMGSLWTFWWALERPERAAAMVHVGCPALLLGSAAPLPMRLLSVPALARVMTRLEPPSPKQVERLARMVHEHPLVPELADLLLATERLPGYEATFLSMLHALLRLRGARPELALTESQLAAVRQPVQLVWGADDPFAPEAVGRRAAEILPRAEFHVVEGGHAPWVRRPQIIGRLARDFLARHFDEARDRQGPRSN